MKTYKIYYKLEGGNIDTEQNLFLKKIKSKIDEKIKNKIEEKAKQKAASLVPGGLIGYTLLKENIRCNKINKSVEFLNKLKNNDNLIENLLNNIDNMHSDTLELLSIYLFNFIKTTNKNNENNKLFQYLVINPLIENLKEDIICSNANKIKKTVKKKFNIFK